MCTHDRRPLQDGAREQWEAIEDLDTFFVRVYTYYRERGLQCILASRIISLLTLAFTILLFICRRSRHRRHPLVNGRKPLASEIFQREL